MADIKVPVLREVEKEKESAKGHTYIHFGGDLKVRFKALAEDMGYQRKLNDLGVLIFRQALTIVEADRKADKAKGNK